MTERTFWARLKNSLLPTLHIKKPSFSELIENADVAHYREQGRTVVRYGRRLTAKQLSVMRSRVLSHAV